MSDSKRKWPIVNKEFPCPKCGKTNRCTVAPDGLAGRCWRGIGTWHDKGKPKNVPLVAPKNRPKRIYLSLEDAIRSVEKRSGKRSAGWEYPDGSYIVRFDNSGEKQFRPFHRYADGWRVGDPDHRWPLYRSDELTPNSQVHIVEGEKCCDLMWALGKECVTSAHGSNGADKSDWSMLKGRTCYIFPDNDEPGNKYAERVKAILFNMGCQVTVVHLSGLPEGGDIVDFVNLTFGKSVV